MTGVSPSAAISLMTLKGCKRLQPRTGADLPSMLKPKVQVQKVDGILVAEFWDCLRLDMAPVQELRRRYEAHLKAGGHPDVVIDLLGVEFAGSAALGNFLALHRVAGPKGGRLIFCNVDLMVV